MNKSVMNKSGPAWALGEVYKHLETKKCLKLELAGTDAEFELLCEVQKPEVRDDLDDWDISVIGTHDVMVLFRDSGDGERETARALLWQVFESLDDRETEQALRLRETFA